MWLGPTLSDRSQDLRFWAPQARHDMHIPVTETKVKTVRNLNNPTPPDPPVDTEIPA